MSEMTDGGGAPRPGAQEAGVPFRPRGAYAGYRAFGSGDGAVLVAPQVARRLRSAAESATRERQVTGGLLYGRGWADEQGGYLVIDGCLEAGPARRDGDRPRGRGAGGFALPGADLRLLREDADRMYSSDIEVGWWRSLAALGEFGPGDFATQAELVGPGGVGLLVYGSGPHWGTAYLGPDGVAPDSAGTLVAAVDPGTAAPPDPEAADTVTDAMTDTVTDMMADMMADTGAGLAPEVADIAAGEGLDQEPLLVDPGPAPAAPHTVPPWRRATGRSAARGWAAGRAALDAPGPRAPGDARFAVRALIAATAAAAVIAGVLTSSALVAVIIVVAGSLVISGTVWLSRH